ncbi:META domain-containing protein [Cytophaga aurantiaca]|uniref:META domain-containing protein n=1 Tax=Cytophaga aurantiaca TaxID=29530 RepID=UPI0003783835|nr:META domain-containing protein [Cytophaga aurantiaca]
MIKFYISLTVFTFLGLASCSSHKKALADRTPTDTLSVVQAGVQTSDIRNPYYNVNPQLDLFQKKISFYAENSTEHWELFIKNDSSFTFVLNDKKTVFEFSKVVQDAAGIHYHSKKIIETTDTTQQKKITIAISKTVTPESSSMSHLPFFVSVIIEDGSISTTYEGEGFYISNPGLHDIWVLDSINGQKVDAAKFSEGLPRLEFHLDGGKIYGFGGCNELKGNYFISRNNKLNIELDQIQTMKFCIDASASESEFLAVLNKKRFTYSINNLRLTLVQKDQSTLIFKKVD